jgi:hypothetical protein
VTSNYTITNDFRFSEPQEFLAALAPAGLARPSLSLSSTCIFRGVADAEKHKLVPSSLRPDNSTLSKLTHGGNIAKGQEEDAWIQISSERNLLKNFYLLADKQGLTLPGDGQHYREDYFFPIASNSSEDAWLKKEGWIPFGLQALAGLAQHYGLPTRLLDWSTNYLTAAYFAASNADATAEGEIAVWSADTWVLTNASRSCAGPVPQEFGPLRLIVPPYAGNENLKAQEGVFTHWHLPYETHIAPLVVPKPKANLRPGDFPAHVYTSKIDRRPLNELVEAGLGPNPDQFFEGKTIFARALLPKSKAGQLLSLLHAHGTHAAKLFPGFSGVAKAMIDRVNHI